MTGPGNVAGDPCAARHGAIVALLAVLTVLHVVPRALGAPLVEVDVPDLSAGLDLSAESAQEIRCRVKPGAPPGPLSIRISLVDDSPVRQPFFEQYRRRIPELQKVCAGPGECSLTIPSKAAIPSGTYVLEQNVGQSKEWESVTLPFWIRTAPSVAIVAPDAPEAPQSARKKTLLGLANPDRIVRRAIVHIRTLPPAGEGPEEVATGFVVNANGDVITAAHLLKNAPDGTTIWVRFSPSVEHLTGEVEYVTVSEPFPPSSNEDGWKRQLVILAPRPPSTSNDTKDQIPVPPLLTQARFPYWLPIASRVTARSAGMRLPEMGKDDLTAWVYPKTTKPLELPIVLESDSDSLIVESERSYSEDKETRFLRYLCRSCKEGCSGAPIVDAQGIVWAVHVKQPEDFADEDQRIAHWAHDVAQWFREHPRGRAPQDVAKRAAAPVAPAPSLSASPVEVSERKNLNEANWVLPGQETEAVKKNVFGSVTARETPPGRRAGVAPPTPGRNR